MANHTHTWWYTRINVEFIFASSRVFPPSRKQVLATKAEAERDGVKVPTTLAEYCVRTRAPPPDEGSDLFYDDYYDDEDLEDEDGDCCYDEDDSGNEESWRAWFPPPPSFPIKLNSSHPLPSPLAPC